ncbi:hypothetical protein ES702_01421 [subsurface metagenome]
MTAETRSPTSESGTWHDPTNAYNDDLAYAYCGNGEGGRTHDYEGYGFASEGMINEVRVDVKGHSGDGAKHSANVYVWDGSQWQLVGTITAGAECSSHQFDASSFINTPEKLNNIKTRIESVGLSGGAPGSRYVRVCWIPVYADWTPTPPLEETIVAKTFPMKYLEKPSGAKELVSLVQGATVVEIAKNFPLILIKRGSASELESYWIPISLEVDVMVSVPDSFVGTHIAAVLPDGVDTKLRIEIPIPEDFVSLTKAELLLVPGGTGNLRRSVTTNFGKIGLENYNQHSDSIAVGEVPVTQNKIEAIDVSDAFTGIAAEDIVGFEFTREGSHANDTVNAPCYVIGFRLTYQK